MTTTCPSHDSRFREVTRVTATIFCSILCCHALAADVQNAPAKRPTPFVRDLDTGYLLNCIFAAPKPHFWDEKTYPLSSWETDTRGGTWDVHPNFDGRTEAFHVDWFKLVDSEKTAPVTLKRQIARQSAGKITLEFRFKLPTKMDGVAWQLRDLEQPGVSIATAHGNLCLETPDGKTTVLQPYEPGHDYGVAVVADITAKTADICIDGQWKAKAAPFCRPIGTIDYVLITTGEAATGELFLGPVNIHKSYSLCETFVTCSAGRLPAGWTADPSDGSVAVEEFACGTKPDVFSLKLQGSKDHAATSERHFSPLAGKAVWEYCFLLPTRSDGPIAELLGEGATGVKILAQGGDLCYRNERGEALPLVTNYRTNLWYTVKIVADPATATAAISINGKLPVDGLPLPAAVQTFDGVRFTAAPSAVLWVDDIRVYRHKDYPADYVPAPKPCPASPYLLGVQSCSLWLEGSAYAGWDYVVPHAARRKPYLGWYDEGNPEETDWEIKWQVEHGIGFEMHCWYRPNNAVNRPIKNGVMDHGIIRGLFNARYSHLKKFAIMYTNWGAGETNPADFRENILPYWIEYFFKDPRYLRIDNQPVLSIYDIGNFERMFGGVEGCRQAVQELRRQCVQAGFAGAIVLMEHGVHGIREAQCLECLKKMKAVGADYVYAYNWGMGPTWEVQKKDNELQKKLAAAAGIQVLPSIVMGAEITAWGGYKYEGNLWVPVGDYRLLAGWVKEDFMPALPKDSLGRRIVMLSNWNEFGEGSFLMPSALAGFAYIDVLRDVFTDGGPHTDVVPTERQKRRFTVLFPKD